jgi:hypothetical protein
MLGQNETNVRLLRIHLIQQHDDNRSDQRNAELLRHSVQACSLPSAKSFSDDHGSGFRPHSQRKRSAGLNIEYRQRDRLRFGLDCDDFSADAAF